MRGTTESKRTLGSPTLDQRGGWLSGKVVAAGLGFLGLVGAGACVEKVEFTDADGDGFPYNVDCDDTDATINPDASDGDVCNSGEPGICSAGTLRCVAKRMVCVATLQPEPVESCNSLDDDCDGDVDEGCGCVNGVAQDCYGGSPDTRGVGQCEDGLQTCVNGDWAACVGSRLPAPEQCDHLDHDCDGGNTNGDPGGGGTCNTGLLGACATGILHCIDETLVCVPNVQPDTNVETCNGVDDNCNGPVDEGNPGGGDSCSVPGALGACANGVWQCQGGILVCVGPLPISEECDNIDNDCDGDIDDNLGQTTCGIGACAVTVNNCLNGSTQTCQPTTAGTELCANSIDDDCDGLVDEVSFDLCDGIDNDCAGLPDGTPEICDGQDNDCDGLVDDEVGIFLEKVDFLVNCDGFEITENSNSPLCGSYVGIPFVAHYPNNDNDADYDISWSTAGSPSVTVKCSNSGGFLSGHVVFIRTPQPNEGTIEARSISLEHQNGSCDDNVLTPALSIPPAGWSHSRLFSFNQFDAQGNDDSCWWADISFTASTPKIWADASSGSKSSGAFFDLAFPSNSPYKLTGAIDDCVYATSPPAPMSYSIAKPMDPNTNTPFAFSVPLVTVHAFWDDYQYACNQDPSAGQLCIGNSDDTRGYDINIIETSTHWNFDVMVQGETGGSTATRLGLRMQVLAHE